MLGLFVLNNDAVNIVIFPIGSKYFWAFLLQIAFFTPILCIFHKTFCTFADALWQLPN